MGWTKAISDEDITGLVQTYLRAYLDQVRHFVDNDRDHEWSLRLENARGPVKDALLTAQLSTRIDLLNKVTVVEDYDRRFRIPPGVRELKPRERARVENAFTGYHCVSDVDDAGTPLVDFQVEDAVAAVVQGREDQFVAELAPFVLEYSEQARKDHRLFVDAFRAGNLDLGS